MFKTSFCVQSIGRQRTSSEGGTYLRRKELTSFPLWKSRNRMTTVFSLSSLCLHRHSNWRQPPAGKSLKRLVTTLVNQRNPRFKGTFKWIFLMPSISVGDRPSVGERTIPMPCCVASEGGKDCSTDLQHVLTNLRNSTRLAGRFNRRIPLFLIWIAGGRNHIRKRREML